MGQRTRQRRASLALGILLVTTFHAGSAAAEEGPDSGWTWDQGDMTVAFVPDEGGEPGFSTQDAGGCNGHVCIYLTGSGTHLDRWMTTADVASASCTSASFWADGAVVRRSTTVCTSGSGTVTATWNNPGTFPHGTQACNSWSGVQGHPCKMIFA